MFLGLDREYNGFLHTLLPPMYDSSFAVFVNLTFTNREGVVKS